jgi:hypothetical protein
MSGLSKRLAGVRSPFRTVLAIVPDAGTAMPGPCGNGCQRRAQAAHVEAEVAAVAQQHACAIRGVAAHLACDVLALRTLRNGIRNVHLHGRDASTY